MSSKTPNRQKQRTRTALLKTGFQLIVEKGYDAVRVVDITRAANYGRATFYVHFADMEALAQAILDHHITFVTEHIIDVTQEVDPALRPLHAWRIIFAYVDMERRFYPKLGGDRSQRLRLWHKSQLVIVLQSQIESGFYDFETSISPAIMARFVVAGLLDILDYWLDHPEAGSPEEMANTFYELVYRKKPPQNDSSAE